MPMKHILTAFLFLAIARGAAQAASTDHPRGLADLAGGFDGDISPAHAQAAEGTTSRTLAQHFNDTLSPLDFGGKFEGGDESLSLDAYRGSFPSMALLRMPRGSFTYRTPPVSGYPGTQIWISDGARDAASGNSFRIFPTPTGDTVISNYAGTLNIAKNGNHAGDGAVVSVDYNINTPAKNWNTPENPVYNAHFGITENCEEANIENRGQVYCLSSQLTAASYNGAIKTDANLFAIRPAIRDTHGPRSQISGINTGVIDQTGLPSSKAGGIESAEIDLYASGADDGHDRVALIVGSQQQKDDSHNNLEVGNGILLRAGAYTFYDSAFQIMGAYKDAAIDLRYANTGCPGDICAPALWLGELGPISFGHSDPNRVKIFGDYQGNLHFVTRYADALELTGSGDTAISGRLIARQGLQIGASSYPAITDDEYGTLNFVVPGPDRDMTRSLNALSISPDGEVTFNSNVHVGRDVEFAGNVILDKAISTRQGIVLPTMTEKQIRHMTAPAEGQIVNDQETHAPVIFEQGHWYHIPLGKEL